MCLLNLVPTKQVDSKKTIEELASLRAENDKLRRQLEELQEENERLSEETQSAGAAAQEEIAALEKKVKEGEAQRRKMHNTIQELRGNVRVFARVRPYLPGDKASSDAEPWLTVSPDNTSVSVYQDRGAGPESSHFFNYDHCFSPAQGQEEVFTEVSDFVQSALDGFNVCLFSYGQTGSGKTHTMQGSGTGQRDPGFH